MVGREVERSSVVRQARVLRLGVLLVGAVLLVPSVTNCGGRSSREGEGDGGSAGDGASSGDAGVSSTGGVSSGGVPAGGEAGVSVRGGGPSGGVTSGGVSSGGVSSGGAPRGGSAGTSPDPRVCFQPVESGSCLAYFPAYWFDAATGVCMPFAYGGCEGNDNRFSTMEQCYAACGGKGLRDDAACSNSSECRAQRLAEPCCSTELREFVGIGRGNAFSCEEPVFGCNPCAAGCAVAPEDGYIGASCVDGHCIPFDARTVGARDCNPTDGCTLRYGVGCCEDCEFQYPSKLVALSRSFDFASLSCGVGISCAILEDCEYPLDLGADCISGTCQIVGFGG